MGIRGVAYQFRIFLQQFESANQRRGPWLPNGPDARHATLSLPGPLPALTAVFGVSACATISIVADSHHISCVEFPGGYLEVVHT